MSKPKKERVTDAALVEELRTAMWNANAGPPLDWNEPYVGMDQDEYDRMWMLSMELIFHNAHAEERRKQRKRRMAKKLPAA